MTERDWNKKLEQGEVLLWYGKPYSGFVFGIELIAVTFFSVIFLVSSTGLAFMLKSETDLFWLIFLVGLFVALFLICGWLVFDRLKRQKISYALTNKRALQSGPIYRKMKSITFEDFSNVKLIESKYPSVEYAQVFNPRSSLIARCYNQARTLTVAFWRIEDAEKVYHLILKNLIREK